MRPYLCGRNFGAALYSLGMWKRTFAGGWASVEVFLMFRKAFGGNIGLGERLWAAHFDIWSRIGGRKNDRSNLVICQDDF